MEELKFKTEAELLKRLIDGPLWSDLGERLHFSIELCGFQITERTQTYKLETTAWLNIPLYTSEPFNPDTCPDKAIVLVDESSAEHRLRFWDAKNKTTFKQSGERDGYEFNTYKRIPDEEAPYMVPLRKNLED